MFLKPRPAKAGFPSKPVEQRAAKREPLVGITAMVRSENGVVLEGVVQDVSDGGIGISGDMTGLLPGEKVEVVLVIQGERVGYFGQVRHMDPRNQLYGVLFKTGPSRGYHQNEAMKECRQCRKEYPEEHKFCFRCGQRLIGGQRLSTTSPSPAPASPP
jgi:PilZ domain